MRNSDWNWLLGLGLGAGYLWWRDTGWLTAPGDALPLLLGFPLFAWLAGPWQLSATPERSRRPAVVTALILGSLGLITGLGLFLALAWTATLWAWLGPRLRGDDRARAARLLPLTVLAFPWITLDFPMLSWWYRWSGAWAAEQLFSAVGLTVQREGTLLTIQHLPFDVSPACSGIKALQAMLTAGTVLCHFQLPAPSRTYWFSLACLPGVAWLANTLRVWIIVIAGLTVGPEFASGWFHDWSSWFVIVAIFGLLWPILDRAGRRNVAPLSAP